MSLVARHALRGLHGSKHLFTRGGCGSLGQRRSIHRLVPCLGQPREPSDDSPAATAAKDPSWVLLDSLNCRRVVRDDDSMAAESKTLAESTGQHHLRVSFRLAAPPAISVLCYDYAGAAPDDKNIPELAIIAAHGDSILLRMKTRRRHHGRCMPPTFDHFVYRARTAMRPPSLTLLPSLISPREHGRPRFLHDGGAGVLRRGQDDLLVAQLDTGHHDDRPDLADLCVLCLGRSSGWEHKCAVPIVHEEGVELMGTLTGPDMTIPVGDRFLCWFSYDIGIVVCDMAEEASPKLQHIHLPVYLDPSYYTNDLPPLTGCNTMGAAGPGAVRFVAIEPRCCCGRLGRSLCVRSRFAFTVTTWTLILTMDEPMAWVRDGVLDCEELWAMPGYEGLPRMHLQSPVLSLDNPDVICFKVGGKNHGDQKTWMIQVDTRRKALLAAVQWTWTDPFRRHVHIPAKI